METETLPGLDGIQRAEATPEPTPDPYVLGVRVAFTHTLQRRTEYRDREVLGQPRGSRERWKLWVPQHAPYGSQGGLVVGRRTLANGRAEHEWEAGTQWYPGTAERFRAYLVAWHLDKRPVLVLPEHLSLL